MIHLASEWAFARVNPCLVREMVTLWHNKLNLTNEHNWCTFFVSQFNIFYCISFIRVVEKALCWKILLDEIFYLEVCLFPLFKFLQWILDILWSSQSLLRSGEIYLFDILKANKLNEIWLKLKSIVYCLIAFIFKGSF